MKKILILFLSAALLAGCAAKGKQPLPTPTPQATQTNQEQTDKTENTETPDNTQKDDKKSEEVKPNVKDLEKLIEKSNTTTDEEERKRTLAEIQEILEQAEKNAPKN